VIIPLRYWNVLLHHLPRVERSALRLVRSGYANDVVIVDDRLAVRFAKHSWGVEALAAESKVLGLVGPRLTVPVPRFETWGEDVVAYPLLPGRPLEVEDFLRLPIGDRWRIVEAVATFLSELHAIPVADVAAVGIGAADSRECSDGYEGLMEEARQVLFPVRGATDRDRMLRLFAEIRGGVLTTAGSPTLIHADLAACHVLWDGVPPRLCGVIDFGCSGLGQPAGDVAALMEVYGETFLDMLLDALPAAREWVDYIRASAALGRLQQEIDEVKGVQ